MKQKKTKAFLFRCTPEEAKAFADAAEALGITKTEWIRQACRKAAGLPSMKIAKEKVDK